MPGAEFILVAYNLAVPNTALQAVAGKEPVQFVDFRDVRAEADDVRRPLRGIQLKRDTFATLSVYSSRLSPTLKNSSAQKDVNYTTNFILQAISEARSEKFQQVTTFGSTYGFFFGEQPRQMTFNAILLNTADFQWEIEWWSNYEEFTRGTKLVDKQVRAYMTYDDVVIEGYITNAMTTKNAQNPHEVNLTFTMWVTGVEYLVEPGDRNFPEADGGLSIDFSGVDKFQGQLNSRYPFTSLTSAVRARNMEQVTQQSSGLLGQLRASLTEVQDFTGKIGQTLTNVKNFLYGRNLVIPAGFAGSEAVAGRGSIVTDNGDVISIGGAVNIQLPVNLNNIGDPKTRTKIYDNVDEYPVRSGAMAYKVGSETFNAAANAAGVPAAAGGSWADLEDEKRLAIWPAAEDVDAFSTKAAEAAFAKVGIDINNMDGQSTSETSRLLGRAAFAAINLGASATGASQAAASLTVGNVVGKIASDETESATQGPPLSPNSGV